MSAAAPAFRQLQQLFRSAGINDDIRIAVYVAFLLLNQDRWDELRGASGHVLNDMWATLRTNLERDFPGGRYLDDPLIVSYRSGNRLAAIINHLEQAIKDSPHNESTSVFFQREVRFELLKGTGGEQYPTPYQIATFLAALGVTSETTTVFDPAAGSGGLLAAACELRPQSQSLHVSGCEYDASWAALAVANLRLHGQSEREISQESALAHLDPQDGKFDSVLMNPPFSGSRPIHEAEHPWNVSEYGTATANVLTVKALQLLRVGGRAVVLVPSGLLFGGGANGRLRRFLARHHLEAVVTLDKECFQPFSHVDAHAIVVQKQAQEGVPNTQPVWMYSVLRDGYPPGAGRDLTAEPNAEVNELPRVRELILAHRDAAWPAVLSLNGAVRLQAISIRPPDGLAGAAVRFLPDSGGLSLSVSAVPSGALVRVLAQDGLTHGIVALPYHESESVGALVLEPDSNTSEQWQQVLRTSEWEPGVPARYEDAGDKYIVTTENAPENENTYRIRLAAGAGRQKKPKKSEMIFEPEPISRMAACLLDARGVLLSPWLYFQGNNNGFDTEFGKQAQAYEVVDANTKRCGWLLNLTEKQATTEHEPRTGWLLIGDSEGFVAFKSADQARWGLLIQSPEQRDQVGWLWGSSGDTKILHIELGSPLPLRADLPLQGLAVGPTAGDAGQGSTIFGVLVRHSYLVPEAAEPRTFEPRAYLPEPPPPAVTHPSVVIAAIRKNQTRLSARIDGLLQLMAHSNAAQNGEEAVQFSPALVGLLDGWREQIWRVIEQLPTTAGSSAPFDLESLRTRCAASGLTSSDEQLIKTLDLFARLGLICEVHVQGRNCYRRVRAADIVQNVQGRK